MTWRDKFRPIVAAVIEAGSTESPEAQADLYRALRTAWKAQDLGPIKRSGSSWPYKMWRDEIRQQLAARGIAGAQAVRKRKVSMSKEEAREWLRKHQMPLF